MGCLQRYVCAGNAAVSLKLPISTSTPVKNKEALQLFSDARADLPKPSAEVTAESKPDCLLLKFALPEGSSNVHHAEFYSTEPGLVDLGADQTLKFVDGRYHLQVPLLRPLSLRRAIFPESLHFPGMKGKEMR